MLPPKAPESRENKQVANAPAPQRFSSPPDEHQPQMKIPHKLLSQSAWHVTGKQSGYFIDTSNFTAGNTNTPGQLAKAHATTGKDPRASYTDATKAFPCGLLGLGKHANR